MSRIRPLVSSVILPALFVATGCSGPGPGATLERFVIALDAGELTEAAALVAGPAVEQSNPEEVVAALQEGLREFTRANGVRVQILSERVEGDRAQVVARLVTGAGEQETERWNLVQTDGQWMIYLEPGDLS